MLVQLAVCLSMWPCGKLQTYAGCKPALSAGEAYIKHGWMDVVTVINTTLKELYFQFKKNTNIFVFLTGFLLEFLPYLPQRHLQKVSRSRSH